MPQGDRRGPRGAGPRSGRGLGNCQGKDTPGFEDPVFGQTQGWRRSWFGRFGGFGRRHRFFATGRGRWNEFDNAPPTGEESLQDLKAEEDWLARNLDQVRKHIQEIGTKEK
jgi:hypothetical protein